LLKVNHTTLGRIAMTVDHKVAVVTGGVSGIALALCTQFAAEGAHVVLSDLDQEACQRRAAPIGAFPIGADVGREADIDNLVAPRFKNRVSAVANGAFALIGSRRRRQRTVTKQQVFARTREPDIGYAAASRPTTRLETTTAP
jgi:NAD(P)-dependent dehydrogenase (short-subunit alcohol dehydrogenase family)